MAKLGLYAVSGLAAASGAFGWGEWKKQNDLGDHRNFELVVAAPPGWKSVPHGPQTLFLYRDPGTGLLLRGAHSQIVADFNPTPGMDGPRTAQFYVERTLENQPGWTAEHLGEVKAKNGHWNLIRRGTKQKGVVTAFGVQGNTTLLITLSGNKSEITALDKKTEWLKSYLAKAEFRLKEYAR